MHLHWDGDNDSVDERNLSAALGAGVTPVTVDHAALKRVRDWIWTLPPPKYPYAIDEALAARGAPRLPAALRRLPRRPPLPRRRQDAGARVGQVEPIDAIGTDRHRLDSYTVDVRGQSVRALSGLAVPVHALPQDQRLRQPSARRHLAARAVPAQRLGADAARSARAARAAADACSIAATTCSIRRGRLRVDVPSADGQTFFALRHVVPGQRQRRTSLRHDAADEESARSSST